MNTLHCDSAFHLQILKRSATIPSISLSRLWKAVNISLGALYPLLKLIHLRLVWTPGLRFLSPKGWREGQLLDPGSRVG